ncbi:serine/threonine-protein kinase [Nonomuraea sp. NPDC046570]|uniref:serine/threonine-protein kinase n=1 Tax=Nonomuraea sp. NPDC046570 TaxID=3155255 RepID=UPI0033CDD2EB
MPQIAPLMAGDPSQLGSFTLSGRIGEGGQGIVYLGIDGQGQRAAIKLLHVKFSGDTIARSRFARELKAAQRVASFCTARVVEADLEGNTPYIASEYIDGLPLREIVDNDGPLTGSALERLAIGTATALTAIHHASIIHRDFKPDNVLIAADGPRVVDFGIARIIDSTGTITSRAIGTPAYMAPEQIAGDDIGPYTDVFAWGATIAFAATGVTVFEGNSIAVVLNRILNHEVDVEPLPEPLRGVVRSALAKKAEDRPSADEILLRLLGHPAKADASPAVLSQGVQVASDDTTPIARLPTSVTDPPAPTPATPPTPATHPTPAKPTQGAHPTQAKPTQGVHSAQPTALAQLVSPPHAAQPGHQFSTGQRWSSGHEALAGRQGPPGGQVPGRAEGAGPARRPRTKAPWIALAVAVVLVAAVVLATLAKGWPLALGTEPVTTKRAGAGFASVADKIAATGQVRIGIRNDVPGVGFQNRPGSPYEGFDIDVARRLAAELGVRDPSQITFVPLTKAERVSALESGKVDLVVATFSVDDSGAQFAGPYYQAHQDVLVRDDGSIEKLADLRGKTVCNQGSTAVGKVQDLVTVKLVRGTDYADCMRKISEGEADAMTGDDLILAGFANRENVRYKIIGARLSNERYAVAVAKGDARTCEAIKGAIGEFYAQGVQGSLVRTHFGHVDFKPDLKVPAMEPCR